MKILSIETTSNICSVCILENEKQISKIELSKVNTHSESLMPIIDTILKENNLQLSNMDLLVCDKGPGSFTGIRIGIATIKAFSDSLNIPCVAINSLEALASSVNSLGLIVSIIDAKNENCYFALYNNTQTDLIEVISPKACSIYDVIDEIINYLNSSKHESFQVKHEAMDNDNFLISFIGDGSYNYKQILENNLIKRLCCKLDNNLFNNFSNISNGNLINNLDNMSDGNIIDTTNYSFNLSFSLKNDLNSFFVGLCGYKKFKKGILEDVLPLYLKKPQAQRQLEEKLSNN